MPGRTIINVNQCHVRKNSAVQDGKGSLYAVVPAGWDARFLRT